MGVRERPPYAGRRCKNVLRSEQCNVRCRNCCLGHETSLRFGSSRDGDPSIARWQEDPCVGGPGKGTIEIDGSQWIPYQPASFPTPPFPDYVSGHSTYSAAAAGILMSWTGSDRFGYSVALSAGSSRIEPGITPRRQVVLSWENFTDAANEAGLSRRYGGIHFRRADLVGRLLGRLVCAKAWSKAQSYFDGTAKYSVHELIAASTNQ